MKKKKKKKTKKKILLIDESSFDSSLFLMNSMYIHTVQPITFKSPISFKHYLPQILNSTTDKPSSAAAVHLSLHNSHRASISLKICNSAAVESENRINRFSSIKQYDVATLGNLCVDVVLSVPKLPPDSLTDRQDYMNQLSKSPPDKVCELRYSILRC